jgi:DNA polymerase
MIGDYIALLRASLSELKKEGIVRLPVQESTLVALRSALPAVKLLIPEKSIESQNEVHVAGKQRENKIAQQSEIKSESRIGVAVASPGIDSKSRINTFRDAPPPSSVARARAGTATAVAAPASAPLLPPPPTLDLPAGDKTTRLDWLRERVLSDPTCKANLHPGKQLVFGVGTPDADLFFCGEAPGAEEETAGEPFVGPAGQLLTRIIGAMGLKREQVYIGNILKWRPDTGRSYGNRPPTVEEMAYCLPFLRAQLEIIRPKVIIALGNTAVNGLLGHDPKRTMSSIQGRWQDYEGVPLIPTYHPSYLLRMEGEKGTSSAAKSAKRTVWESMLSAMERVGLPISDRQRTFFR